MLNICIRVILYFSILIWKLKFPYSQKKKAFYGKLCRTTFGKLDFSIMLFLKFKKLPKNATKKVSMHKQSNVLFLLTNDNNMGTSLSKFVRNKNL